MSAEIPLPRAPGTSLELPSNDWVLEELVRVANNVEGFSVGVTLTVGGGIITGTLIGFREYFREYGKLWRHILGDTPAGRNIEEHWSKRGVTDYDEMASQESPKFTFLHIKNARYVYGATLVPSVAGLLWRGRLSQVSGFSLGTLAPGDEARAG